MKKLSLIALLMSLAVVPAFAAEQTLPEDKVFCEEEVALIEEEVTLAKEIEENKNEAPLAVAEKPAPLNPKHCC